MPPLAPSLTKDLSNARIAVVGLGYVGLPLAIEFGTRFPTIGFDIDTNRVEQLNNGLDVTREVETSDFQRSEHLTFSADIANLEDANVYIVTVPTPIDEHKSPDMGALRSASRTIGGSIKPGDIVIYESTVYPGATEEVCIPVIEEVSGLVYNQDFFAGYSPERINPGDKQHRLPGIVKVTSGSTEEVAEIVDELYRSIIVAGTHKAGSIRVAEAAKVIENTQRDLNIALINELALIFERLEIDTEQVLSAAATKWNFLPFKPGLVGGHCIGVDPYYLTFKAQEIGYHPEVILAGRRINDSMAVSVVDRILKLMTRQRIHVVESNVLVLGLAFKENCPDIRNTKVVDVVREFERYNANVDVYDPWVDPEEAAEEYGITMIDGLKDNHYDAIVLAVAHEDFVALGVEAIRRLGKENCVLFDIKHSLPADQVTARL